VSYSFGPTFFEPSNIMCSKKCEMPVMPGRSLREPTLNHCQKVTVGTEWSSCVSRTSPLSSTVRSTLKVSGVMAAGRAAAFASFTAGFAAAGTAPSASMATSATPTREKNLMGTSSREGTCGSGGDAPTLGTGGRGLKAGSTGAAPAPTSEARARRARQGRRQG